MKDLITYDEYLNEGKESDLDKAILKYFKRKLKWVARIVGDEIDYKNSGSFWFGDDEDEDIKYTAELSKKIHRRDPMLPQDIFVATPYADGKNWKHKTLTKYAESFAKEMNAIAMRYSVEFIDLSPKGDAIIIKIIKKY